MDSGFPVFAAMQNRNPGHAVAVVGYELRQPLRPSVAGLRYAWDEVKSLAVIDDNCLPYLSIPVKAGAGPYSAEDIDAFIVALPEKIYYPAEAVEKLAPTLSALGQLVTLPANDQSVIRYFITTGSAFRRFARRGESDHDPELLKAIMTLPFAQFVWVIEIATHSQWETNEVSARAVVDATASWIEQYPLWLLHNRTQALIFTRDSVSLDLQSGISVFPTSDMRQTGFTRFYENFR